MFHQANKGDPRALTKDELDKLNSQAMEMNFTVGEMFQYLQKLYAKHFLNIIYLDKNVLQYTSMYLFHLVLRLQRAAIWMGAPSRNSCINFYFCMLKTYSYSCTIFTLGATNENISSFLTKLFKVKFVLYLQNLLKERKNGIDFLKMYLFFNKTSHLSYFWSYFTYFNADKHNFAHFCIKLRTF